MAGIEKGVTLRHIAKVLYGAFKGESITRPVLGRFGKIDCEDSAKQKSELANEDHCGTCATYVLQKQEELGDKNKSVPENLRKQPGSLRQNPRFNGTDLKRIILDMR